MANHWASDDVSAKISKKRGLNEAMAESLVNQSKTLTVISFSQDKLAPQLVGYTVDGGTGVDAMACSS